MTRYQVIGECAHVVVADSSGVNAMNLLYKGAYLPPGVDPKRLQHLIDSGLVAEEGEVPLAPNSPVETAGDAETGSDETRTPVVPPEGDGVHPVLTEEQRQAQREKSEANAEVEAKRAAARQKLAAIDGGVPDGRASKDVLVEYLAANGYLYDEVVKEEKPKLADMAKQVSQQS